METALLTIVGLLSLGVITLAAALWLNCASLRKQNTEQHRLLMSFHNAGVSLAGHELKMAQIKADEKRAEADLEANRLKSRELDSGQPSGPRYGKNGHQRVAVTEDI